MKTLHVLSISLGLFITSITLGQVSVNVKVGGPPAWGPVGYNAAQYYYLPDVEAYYDIPSAMFIYNERGAWVHRAYLPHRYRNYNLYGGYKVVMDDYHGNTPYTFYGEHKKKFAPGFRGPSQKTIGNRPGKPNYKSKIQGNGSPNKKMGPGNVRNKDNKKNSGHENGKGKRGK